MAYEELTQKYLNRLSQQIAEKMPRDTGSAASSLEVQGNKLLGNSYIFQLDQGRGPGKFPPIRNIAEWVKRKLGLDDKEAKQVAYLVSRKIANEGTEIYKDKSLGLELDRLINAMLTELYEELPEYAAAEAFKFLKI